MDGSRIRNKTVSFSFENGVVWTGSKSVQTSGGEGAQPFLQKHF